jgi:XisI protein
MEKMKKYKQIIQSLLEEYAQFKPANLTEVENQLVFDEKRNVYQLLRHGFEDRKRVFYIVFQMDIKDGKIWVQQDTTDVPIVQRLLDAGVPKSDIVLGFHAPYKRALAGFAVA